VSSLRDWCTSHRFTRRRAQTFRRRAAGSGLSICHSSAEALACTLSLTHRDAGSGELMPYPPSRLMRLFLSADRGSCIQN